MTTRSTSVIPLLLLAIILGMTAQGVFGLPYQLRLSSAAENYWMLSIGVILFPVLLGWFAMSLSRRWIRRFSFLCAILLLLPCLFASSCAAHKAPQLGQVDLSYELLSEAKDDEITYRLYRTNCGATCAYGLDLRKERDLFLGIKLVSPFWSKYQALAGEVTVKNQKIQVSSGTEVLVTLEK
jgi:MFS family permease